MTTDKKLIDALSELVKELRAEKAQFKKAEAVENNVPPPPARKNRSAADPEFWDPGYNAQPEEKNDVGVYFPPAPEKREDPPEGTYHRVGVVHERPGHTRYDFVDLHYKDGVYTVIGSAGDTPPHIRDMRKKHDQHITGEPFMMSEEATGAYFGKEAPADTIPRFNNRKSFVKNRADIIREFEYNKGAYRILLGNGYRLDRSCAEWYDVYRLYSMGLLVEHSYRLAELLDILVAESIIVG